MYPEEVVDGSSPSKKDEDVADPSSSSEDLEPQKKKAKVSPSERKRKPDEKKESPFKRARKASARVVQRAKGGTKVNRKLEFGEGVSKEDREKEVVVAGLFSLACTLL